MSNPELYSKLENPINPASPSQLGILFFDALGLKDVSRKRSTAIGIIQDLTRMYPKHKRLFDSVLEIRKYSKQLSTYVDKFPKLIKEKTGRMHGKYNIYGADTGRMSSKGPNLQNIPKYTGPRRMFAATPGYLMVGCDYSQQEPRLLSFLCGDEAMKQAYIDGKDLYSTMAHSIFGGNYTDYLKKDEAEAQGAIYNPKGEIIRDRVKAILLGIMYSKGAKAIAEDLNISVKEAKDAMALFHNTFPKVSQYEQSMKDFCRTNGYVQTIRGRKRRLPDIRMPRYEITGNASEELREQIMNKLSNTWSKDAKDKLITHWRQKLGVVVKDNSGYIAQAERQVVNSIVQGSAGDMTKLAMILFSKSERMREMGGRMLLIIHDEIIIEVPRENAKEASELLEAIMIEAAGMLMDVPVSCDSEIFECWEGENIEL
jgi:DNA polymerase I-like protein with 3'-5' exonuclease and polymerase domains